VEEKAVAGYALTKDRQQSVSRRTFVAREAGQRSLMLTFNPQLSTSGQVTHSPGRIGYASGKLPYNVSTLSEPKRRGRSAVRLDFVDTSVFLLSCFLVP